MKGGRERVVVDAAGEGRRRSTTPRTTRTCVCKMLTRVHALACGRTLAHTSAPTRLIKRSESSIRVGRRAWRNSGFARDAFAYGKMERVEFSGKISE